MPKVTTGSRTSAFFTSAPVLAAFSAVGRKGNVKPGCLFPSLVRFADDDLKEEGRAERERELTVPAARFCSSGRDKKGEEGERGRG